MAFFMFRWGLVRRRSESRIAAPSSTAASDSAALSRSRKVEHLLARLSVVNDSAYWDRHLNRRSVVSRSVAAFTMPAALSRMFRIEPQVEQRVVVLARNQDNIAAVSTIAATRTATRHIFFAPKREAAVTAVASFYRDCDLIDEQLWGLALRDDVNKFTKPAAVAKLDGTRNRGKQRIVFPESHVLARLVARATLPHDDRATGHDLA
jgi:hypothetical protein